MIKMKNINFIILLLLFYGYFKSNIFLDNGFWQVINVYFGRMQYLIYIVMIFNFLIRYVKSNKKRNIFTVINYYIYLVVYSVFYLLLSWKLNLFSNVIGVETRDKFLSITIFDYKLGLVTSYLLEKGLFVQNKTLFYIIFLICGAILLIMGIIIYNWIIVKNIKKLVIRYEKMKKNEKEEKEIKEKILIKEFIEKNESEKLIKINEDKQRQIEKLIAELKEKYPERINSEKIIEEDMKIDLIDRKI
jgi:hypothetical protein